MAKTRKQAVRLNDKQRFRAIQYLLANREQFIKEKATAERVREAVSGVLGITITNSNLTSLINIGEIELPFTRKPGSRPIVAQLFDRLDAAENELKNLRGLIIHLYHRTGEPVPSGPVQSQPQIKVSGINRPDFQQSIR